MKKIFNNKKHKIFLVIISNIIFCLNLFSTQLFIPQIDTKEKIIFLTFDDGPGPWTKEVLNVLDKYNIKATFFVLGELVEYKKEVVKQAHFSGHEIGIHLFSHKNFYQIQKKYSLKETQELLVQEIESSLNQVEKTVGTKPRYLRMPYGYYRSWMDKILQKYGLKVINWSFGCDWTKVSSEEMSKKYCLNLRPGGIYLFHDGGKDRKKTVLVLENFINYALKNGYTFGQLKDYVK
jgi:peptidoglycan/xylan/chitin deacetylase (PgdA/CDA1 family)